MGLGTPKIPERPPSTVQAFTTMQCAAQQARVAPHSLSRSRTDGVVATGVVVGGVLLAGDELLGVVQVAVRARADLVHARGLEVNHQTAGHELARACKGHGVCRDEGEGEG